MISMQLHGMAELQGQLKALNDVALSARVLAAAMRKAFKPVLEAALANASTDSRALVEAIKLSSRQPKGGGFEVGLKVAGPKKTIGPRTKSQATKLAPKSRWHFIEFGTAKMRANPFLRPALDNNAAAVLALLNVELSKGIERAVYKSIVARGKAAGA